MGGETLASLCCARVPQCEQAELLGACVVGTANVFVVLVGKGWEASTVEVAKAEVEHNTPLRAKKRA